MRLALVGYGRMGREVEVQAKRRGHTIAWMVNCYEDLVRSDTGEVDATIEFTAPDQAVRNIKWLAEKNLLTVTGTTGWYEQLSEIRDLVAQKQTGLLYSPNFSVGVHVFFQLVEHAARLFAAFPEYDVYGHERHHAGKADSPSGTARKLAELVLRHSPQKHTLIVDRLERPPGPEELHFTSTRGGSTVGVHSVFFEGPADGIELTHTAQDRSCFARGAVAAAEWLRGRKGVFTMDDFLADRVRYPSESPCQPER